MFGKKKIKGWYGMKIIVCRHGQTDWNVLKKVMGHHDEPLNEKGMEQARETRNKLLVEDIDLILCSPLTRARQTADIINEDREIPIVYDDRIIERDFGEYEGFPKRDFDFPAFWDYYLNQHYSRAENIQEFFKRVYEFLDDIIEKYPDQTLLIVGHGGISIPIACYFQGFVPEGSLVDAGLALENADIAIYEPTEKKD